jgi:hypothetical protein
VEHCFWLVDNLFRLLGVETQQDVLDGLWETWKSLHRTGQNAQRLRCFVSADQRYVAMRARSLMDRRGPLMCIPCAVWTRQWQL